MVRMAAMIAALLLAAPALAADQFDLVCTDGKKATKRFRVDLAANQWCSDDCGNVRKIANVTPTIIEFVDEQPQFATDDRDSIFVKRATGEWYEFWKSYVGRTPVSTFVQGTCEPAPFTGFGGEKVKF